MNVEEDRLVCKRRFPLQLGVVLVYLYIYLSIIHLFEYFQINYLNCIIISSFNNLFIMY